MATTAAAFFSQFGEDRILSELRAELERGSGSSGPACVDIGANDGVTGSVSLHFERAGWMTVLVEPNPDLCALLRRTRTGFLFEGAASSSSGTATLMLAEGAELAHAVSSLEPDAAQSIRKLGLAVRPVEVRTERLDNILEMAGITPGQLAFVSIDVEGHELGVLQGFDLVRWRPRILLIEDNSLLSGSPVRAYLAQQGYVPFRRTGVNDWYGASEDTSILGDDPDATYRRTMVSARALMARRRVSTALLGVPLVGPLVAAAARAVRGGGGG
ncbi:FkbM family methyltransferase [Sandaracinobacteroides hominis]|uniref:FkbM family methyltransferase n=1 Tax=Sandaracinobacteroides hominis TaxID=2780086 RepID=UPI0018F75DEE|nr:FkbM family methyltransferase [Sandaracinobacteroides hominis]